MPRTETDWVWNPDGCTLLPIFRELIEEAYLSTKGKGNDGYQIVWLPDLPIGPPKISVGHDCRAIPKKLLGGDKMKRIHSVGRILAIGEMYQVCESPYAAHAIYSATCHNCQTVFFSSAWDKEDTLENYLKELKGKK